MVNDISIAGLIIFVFIGVGVLVPIATEGIGGDQTTLTNVEQLESDVNEGLAGSHLSIFDVLLSVASMFVWSFGALPFYLDLLIFLPLRIILALIIARNIWIGGGG